MSQVCPQFRIKSEKYYRDQLDDIYNNVLVSVKKIVDDHNPDTGCLMFDGWSQSHHRYIRYILSYIHDYKRQRMVVDLLLSDQCHTANWLNYNFQESKVDYMLRLLLLLFPKSHPRMLLLTMKGATATAAIVSKISSQNAPA
jgi:hypothetical protein